MSLRLNDQPSVTSARLPFGEQIAFFRGKLGNLVPTARWDDIRHNAHDRAFMVAGATKADLLADLATAVDTAIAEGKGLPWFRENFRSIVQKHGWHGWTGEGTAAGEAWRTKVIYSTNMRTSYAAGRLAQLRDPDLLRVAPFWMYRHSDSVRYPRPLHVSWDKLTLPADHVWFRRHYPPNGWGCQCRVFAVSERTARKLEGRFVEPPDDGIDPKTGAPSGIDKGWDYMPGDTVSDAVRAASRKILELPPPLADNLHQTAAAVVPAAYGKWIDEVLKDEYQRGRTAVIGTMMAIEREYLRGRGIEPERADITLGDRLIKSKKARRHELKGDALTEDEWRTLAVDIQNVDAVLFDNQKQNLLYVFPASDGRKVRVVVEVNYQAKGQEVTNSVRSAFKMQVRGLIDATRYAVVRGQLEE